MKTTDEVLRFLFSWMLIFIISACGTGCATSPPKKIVTTTPVNRWAPKEMAMASLDEYVIETGDLLAIDVPRLVPKPPYTIRSFDAVRITIVDTDAISNVYRVQPGGYIQLGYPYGSVSVNGMTIQQAEDLVREQIQKPRNDEYKSEVYVSLSLEEIQGMQPIYGEHCVGPDGRIQLGSYGSVYINGLTLQEAKEAIEFHLVKYLDSPEVSIVVASYNTKKYYLSLEGAGYGDKTLSYPITGNETVLDAFVNIQGLDRISNANRIRIERPRGPYSPTHQTLIVDWKAISAGACTETNYQLFPGDRVFVEEDKMVAFDTGLSRVIAPFERIMGFALLGVQTATRFSGPVLQGGGDPSGGRR